MFVEKDCTRKILTLDIIHYLIDLKAKGHRMPQNFPTDIADENPSRREFLEL